MCSQRVLMSALLSQTKSSMPGDAVEFVSEWNLDLRPDMLISMKNLCEFEICPVLSHWLYFSVLDHVGERQEYVRIWKSNSCSNLFYHLSSISRWGVKLWRIPDNFQQCCFSASEVNRVDFYQLKTGHFVDHNWLSICVWASGYFHGRKITVLSLGIIYWEGFPVKVRVVIPNYTRK